MSVYAEFDRSQRPLITIHFTGAPADTDNFSTYLAELAHNYEKKEPFALVFELSKAPIPGLSYQLQQAAWMKEHDDLIRQYCMGVAYVIPGTLMRGVLKSIFKVQKQPVPYTVVATFDKGKEWAHSTIKHRISDFPSLTTKS